MARPPIRFALLLLAIPATCFPPPAAPAQESPAHSAEKLAAARSELEKALAEQIENLAQTRNIVQLKDTQDTFGKYVITGLGESFDGQPGLGASLSAADPALRTQLRLPEGQGVVVAGVQPAGAAARAGLKDNDILLSLGETRLAEPDDLDAGLTALGGKDGKLRLLRDGKPTELRVKPRVRVMLDAAGPESPEFFIGVPVRPVNDVLRAHLGIPAGRGLVATDVVVDSPAAQAGVKANDILLSLDGADLADTETLVAKIQASQGKPVNLKLLREGKPTEIAVTPRRRDSEPKTTSVHYSRWAPYTFQVVRPESAAVNQYYTSMFNAAQQAEAARPADDVARRVNAMSAQIKALADAIEALRKDLAPRDGKPAPAQGGNKPKAAAAEGGNKPGQ